MLQRALAAFPADQHSSIVYAYTLFNLGDAYLRSGQPAKAIPYLQQRLNWSDQRPESERRVEGIDWREAMWIGVAQSAAIVPGVSRSGVTITVARLCGVGREASARFSFLLSTPVITGAAALKIRAPLGL